MIDREARDRLALAMRRLAAGRITNDECDDAISEFLGRRDRPGFCDCGYDLRGGPHKRCPECGELSDPALPELAGFTWSHYSDLDTYKLKGRHALTREQRRNIARAVVFLKSHREYSHHLFDLRSSSLRTCGVLLGVPVLAFLVAEIWFGRSAAIPLSVASGLLLMLGAWAWALWSHRPANRDSTRDDGTDLLSRGWPFETADELTNETQQPLFLGGATDGSGGRRNASAADEVDADRRA